MNPSLSRLGAKESQRAGDVLLSALDPTGHAWAERSQQDLSGLPWLWIIERAKHHKVLALLLARLQETGVDEQLPEAARGVCAAEALEVATRAERAARTLEVVRDVAGRLDSPFFIIKGPLLAQEVYGSHRRRVFSDVDVVVPSGRIADFDEALRQQGYFFWASPQIHQDLPAWFLKAAPAGEERGSTEEARRAMSHFHRHFLYVLRKGDPRLPVEVHWHIFVPGDSSATEADVWEHTQELEISGCPVDVLDRAATLLHCAVHALEGGREKHRLLHLADVVWILHRWGSGLDSESLHDLARRWNVEAALTAALEGARNVFPFPLPEATDRLWPQRSVRARTFLGLAGLGPAIVDAQVGGNRVIRSVAGIWSDALWELAWNHAPVEAWGRVRRLFATRVLRRGRVRVLR